MDRISGGSAQGSGSPLEQRRQSSGLGGAAGGRVGPTCRWLASCDLKYPVVFPVYN